MSEPIISGFINAVKQIPGTNKVGAIGFCWGGRYAILQAHQPRGESGGGVDAVYACHPSLLSVSAFSYFSQLGGTFPGREVWRLLLAVALSLLLAAYDSLFGSLLSTKSCALGVTDS